MSFCGKFSGFGDGVVSAAAAGCVTSADSVTSADVTGPASPGLDVSAAGDVPVFDSGGRESMFEPAESAGFVSGTVAGAAATCGVDATAAGDVDATSSKTQTYMYKLLWYFILLNIHVIKNHATVGGSMVVFLVNTNY